MYHPDPELTETRRMLRSTWGYREFREGQREAIDSVLEGRDTLVLFPTGGGKSLCYQLPALLLDGLTLVISPLVSLMEDQVEQLRQLQVPASWINSTIPLHEVEQRLLNARNGMYRLLYLSPERLESPLWQQMAGDLNLSMVAVDEAHCISQWGHDFRPSYRTIREAIDPLGFSLRWMALTATATPEVREDVLKRLKFSDPALIIGRFERPNLQWWVTRTEQKHKTLLRAVRRGVKRGSGVVYAGTRRSCRELARSLQRQGVSADAYHAGLEAGERRRIQSDWMEDRVRVVVATNAFGMGIDKSDCRFVIHYDLPWTLEAYYQEAGRAGRDGETAWPLLLWRDGDLERARERLQYVTPSYERLQTLYDAICDELNLALESEQERFQPVSVESVGRRASSAGRGEVLQGLRQLERLQLLELVQPAEPQIGIHFLVGRQALDETILRSRPEKAEFLDQLSRLTGPQAFERLVFRDSSLLERRLDTDRRSLLRGLEVLSGKDRLIAWQQTDDHPLVLLREPRRSRVPLDRSRVEGYRTHLIEKLELVGAYLESETCRERFLRIYFGETDARACGHCDRCSRTEQLPAGTPESDQLDRVLELLERPAGFSELLKMTGWSRGELYRVLELLVLEGRIGKSETDHSRYRIIG